MEQQILELIEEEVTRRVALRSNLILERISTTYDLPLDRLVKDITGLECTFCCGILKNKKRCLKNPQDNGYCKFHQSQVPVIKNTRERVEAPWQM